MKRILSAIFFLVISTAQAAATIAQQWQSFPLAQLPTLSADTGMTSFLELVRKKGRQQAFTLPGTLYDPANGYANFQLGDEGFLEFIVWNTRQKSGYVVANRYLGESQKFELWKFNESNQFVRANGVLQVGPSEARAAYQRITGRAAKTTPRLHWEFPRKGTTITVSLDPTDQTLLSRCKVISEVEYDCGHALNVAEFKWTGQSFTKRLLK